MSRKFYITLCVKIATAKIILACKILHLLILHTILLQIISLYLHYYILIIRGILHQKCVSNITNPLLPYRFHLCLAKIHFRVCFLQQYLQYLYLFLCFSFLFISKYLPMRKLFITILHHQKVFY